MTKNVDEKLAAYLIALGDDELILGHRDSEWCGHAPILEEDIAFANIAIDEIGHAQLWYQAASKLLGENPETYPDYLAFERPWQEWTCLAIVSLPKGNWAFSILRQLMMDSVEYERLSFLSESNSSLISDIAIKIKNEETYHLRHSSEWVKRLGLGTEESSQKMQLALMNLWNFVSQFDHKLPYESELVSLAYVPESSRVFSSWHKTILKTLRIANLHPPLMKETHFTRENQSKNLQLLLDEMQEIPRTYGYQVAW